MAEKVHSMFPSVRGVSCSDRFSTRTAPRLIGSRRAWLRTATLTSPGSATNRSTGKLFQRTPEKIITLYLKKKKKKKLHAYATCLFVAKIAVSFFSFIKIFEAWNKMFCTISLRKKEICQIDMANYNIISSTF